MAITRTINIDGRDVPFKASAAVPRMYRIMYRRDIFRDLDALVKAIRASETGEAEIDTMSLEMFENIAHMMAKYADPSVPDAPDEWLDAFNTFSIYEIVPQIIELWGINVETEIDAKKNLAQVTAR